MNVYFQSSGNETVDRMGKIRITGNITNPLWYKAIRKKNGKPHFLAVTLLGEIVYWYRPTEIRDETSGNLIGWKKKFRGDLLQKTYEQLGDQFGLEKREVKEAIDVLVSYGLVERYFRDIKLSNGIRMNNVMFLELNVDRLTEITFPKPESVADNTSEENEDETYGHFVHKSEEGSAVALETGGDGTKNGRRGYENMQEEMQKSEGGPTKFCTTPYENSQEGVQKNVVPLAKNGRTLLRKTVGPPTSERRTCTEITTENTDGDYPIHLSRSSTDEISLNKENGSDGMDEKFTKADQYRKLILENTHLNWHLENDPPGEREEYENLVELICDVVCAEHSKPVYINSTAMEPRLVRSRFLKLIDSHIQYVMECLRKNPNHKGIESYRNYKLTCLYNAPVTMDTYYQQQVNHDMESGIWLRTESQKTSGQFVQKWG